MPYRGAIGPRIACAAHAAAEAVANCSRCRASLCDPCTLYFSADPFCRTCIAGARRAWVARIAGGVAGVVLMMALLTGAMLSAIPSHVRSRAAAALPVRHVENCRPFDQWLSEARRDLERGLPHSALHDTALSRRDCSYDPERDRIEAIAYAMLGDKFAAIAAAVRYGDGSNDYDGKLRLDREISALLQTSAAR